MAASESEAIDKAFEWARNPTREVASGTRLVVTIDGKTSLTNRWIGRMPRGPKGETRPADVIGNAVHVMRIATEGRLR